MKITVQIVIDAQDGTPPATEQVAVVARDDLTMATAGLALAEAHEVLSGIQHHLVTAQAAAAAVAGRHCGSCGRARARKDTRHIVLRTLPHHHAPDRAAPDDPVPAAPARRRRR